jgi:hypothetical protein
MRANEILSLALGSAALLVAAAAGAVAQPGALRSQTDQTQRAIAEELRSATKPLRDKAARGQPATGEEAARQTNSGAPVPPPPAPQPAK